MTLKNLPGVVLTTILSLFVSFVAEAEAQSFTKADSGWVRLFNGTDFTGFYSRTYGATAPLVRPPASPYSIEYAGTDTAAIRVGANSTASGSGNIGTDDTTFSHYRLRWEGKFDVLGDVNAGLTYHTDETKARMNNNWPRSIEFQMRQTETGAAFSIQQVTFNTRVTSNRYNPAGTAVTVCQYGKTAPLNCNARNYNGTITVANGSGGVTRWVRYELIARGADTATHIVQDTVVFKLWNIRIFNDSSQTASNRTPDGPHDHGGLGWQAEGGPLRYRRLEVMRIPPTTPAAENFLHRLFLDSPPGSVQINAINPSPVQFQWRSIGTIPKVKIQYRYGTTPWISVVDSTPNTGSYSWNPPPGMTGPPSHFRITSADYVWGDSTNDPTSILKASSADKTLLFTVRNGVLTLPNAKGFDRVDIRDAAGRTVRSLPAGKAEVQWDLTDGQGRKVSPGQYFLKLTGPGATQNARTLIF